MGITYPSGHATDTIGFSAPARAESLRDPACTGLNRVHINLDSPQSMEEAIEKRLKVIESKLKVIEEHLMSLDHGNEGGNDIRDGGWFD